MIQPSPASNRLARHAHAAASRAPSASRSRSSNIDTVSEPSPHTNFFSASLRRALASRNDSTSSLNSSRLGAAAVVGRVQVRLQHRACDHGTPHRSPTITPGSHRHRANRCLHDVSASVTPAMGQPVAVVEKPSTSPGIVRFEANRTLTGMGHERFASAGDAVGPRPAAELARRLFATGKVAGVHIYANMITVDLAGDHTGRATRVGWATSCAISTSTGCPGWSRPRSRTRRKRSRAATRRPPTPPPVRMRWRRALGGRQARPGRPARAQPARPRALEGEAGLTRRPGAIPTLIGRGGEGNVCSIG